MHVAIAETTHIQIVLDWTACDRSVACLGYGGQPVVVGMDCEWVSDRSKQGKVALLQLSTLEHCVLVRLCCLQDGVPDCLRRFLENERCEFVHSADLAPFSTNTRYMYGIRMVPALSICLAPCSSS